jgi:protein-S-isoprenylcysteine O-methyltransferase Ste14
MNRECASLHCVVLEGVNWYALFVRLCPTFWRAHWCESLFSSLRQPAIIQLSWRSLRDVGSHGFYRFFAFELLSALILLNVPVWFRDPLSARQLVSWFLGVASIGLAVEGFRLLRVIGKPAPTAARSTHLPFENTTTLVTVGAYRFIRHPLYASLLALVGCAYLKNPFAVNGIVLALSASGFLIATSVAEERENLVRFGAAYAAYMKRTRRFLPFLF